MAKQALRPLPGFVLIKDTEIKNTILGGFEVAGSDKEKHSIGEVLLCGDAMVDDKGNLINCPVHIGDVAIYKRYFDGGTITWEGAEYKFVPFKDLIGTMEGK